MDGKYYIVQFDGDELSRKFNESTILDPEWFSWTVRTSIS